MTVEGRHQLDEVPASGLDDSGLRHEFTSGAMREMAPGKGRFDLLSPFANAALAEHMERGAVKYAPRNWEKGLPLSSFVDSATRHLGMIMMGETAEPHAVAALWNLHCLVHTQMMIEQGILPKELDDLPDYLGQDGPTSGGIPDLPDVQLSQDDSARTVPTPDNEPGEISV